MNMAGMVADNILKGISQTVRWDEHFREDPLPLTLDVRTEEERKSIYIQGTELCPIDDLRTAIQQWDPEQPIRVYCRIGQRGYFAEQTLKGRGFKDVKNIAGGWRSLHGDLRDDKLFGQEPEE